MAARKRAKRPARRPSRRAARPARSKARRTRATRARRAARPARPAKRSPRAAKPVARSAKPARPAARRAKPARPAAPSPKPARSATAVAKPTGAALDRQRRRLSEVERLEPDPHLLAAARSGHDELKAELARHTESSPKLTAGDVDADWEEAYAIGDEAPGGDNPTPGQNEVDEIGEALGVSYQDDEELKGSDKIEKRDRHRWEYDPASSEDWPHNRDKS